MDWPALITALAGLVGATSVLVRQLGKIRADMQASQLLMQKRLDKVDTNVEKIEVATNSMKDALVKSSSEAAASAATLAERERVAEGGTTPPTDRIGEP